MCWPDHHYDYGDANDDYDDVNVDYDDVNDDNDVNDGYDDVNDDYEDKKVGIFWTILKQPLFRKEPPSQHPVTTWNQRNYLDFPNINYSDSRCMMFRISKLIGTI